MKHLIFQTNNTWTGTLLRWTVGIVFIPHGLQKTLGLFGGMGWDGTMKFFTENLQLPYMVASTVILVEFLGSISLLLGWATRFWALSFIGLLIGIMFSSHLDNGFFMNWLGTQKGEGCQFDILAIGIVVTLLMEGGGKLSVDRWILTKYILKKEL
ncbi:DoxX family protein [Chryseobacterium sp. BIGb0232]|uniref:DoxX family protein n=1 Tax=Chryseobacterium sp. BIGb0232 TaxID=2940598 RepID=UPI000F4A6322|nr:DoxX family protein [Chryseobacterium sp. BIGb0232]MCS4301966.1 putative oxidoreductase [Chryseobacterium sp. BIGb0232]ROS17913.1 putative oxidoreductase [Chryseobacterium nakagawai]